MSFSTRTATALCLAFSLAVIGYVLFSQYVQNYQPCELCLRERLPWYTAIGLGIVGLIRPSPWILAAIGLVFLVATGLGLHHVGVEQKWWEGPQGCTGNMAGANSVEELRKMIQSAQYVRCDEITWTLFGLSMATYDFLVSLAAAVATLFAARRLIGAAHA